MLRGFSTNERRKACGNQLSLLVSLSFSGYCCNRVHSVLTELYVHFEAQKDKQTIHRRRRGCFESQGLSCHGGEDGGVVRYCSHRSSHSTPKEQGRALSPSVPCWLPCHHAYSKVGKKS